MLRGLLPHAKDHMRNGPAVIDPANAVDVEIRDAFFAPSFDWHIAAAIDLHGCLASVAG
jgi:hypothetical protein